MANSWTKEQQAAIESNHQNLLLSAAAGSGKTAVLVGRIIARLTDRTAPIAADRLPVSYTHLDVYKRQMMHSPSSVSATQSITPCSIIFLLL